ncbi:DoxX [Bacillus cereus Rock4-18]|nr:DoxX [Bacillus cereus Rock4-18]
MYYSTLSGFIKKAYRKGYVFFIDEAMKLVFYKQHVNWQQYLPSKYSEELLCILIILTDIKSLPV